MMKARLGSLLALVLGAEVAVAQSAPLAPADLPPQPIPVEAASVSVPPAEIKDNPADQAPIVPGIAKPAPGIKNEKCDEDAWPADNLWRWGDSGEYLLWWIKSSRLPPIVVAGSGNLSQPGTRSLFGGDEPIDMQARSGGSFTLTIPLNEERTLGFHGTYMFLGTRSVDFSAGGTGEANSLSIGRPYEDVITGAEAVRPVALPNQMQGTVQVELDSRLQGVEGNVVGYVYGLPQFQFDLLAGFRYFELDEGLAVRERELSLGPDPAAGTFLASEDRITTKTHFYGGQVGARAEFRHDGVFMNVLAKLAVGCSNEMVRFSGTSIVVPPGLGPQVQPNGDLFALPTDVGRTTSAPLALLPEINVRAGIDLSNSARFFVGYTLIYLTDVVRPGDQIDRGVNPAFIPTAAPMPLPLGPSRPQALINGTSFWAQGLTLGFEYRY